jgi:hypothetical protein
LIKYILSPDCYRCYKTKQSKQNKGDLIKVMPVETYYTVSKFIVTFLIPPNLPLSHIPLARSLRGGTIILPL